MGSFDLPTNTEAPVSIEFRGNESRWEALFYVGFGGWIVYELASKGGWTAVIGVALFGSLFLLLAVGKALGEPDRSVHLAFDEEGLWVPNVFARKVPWPAVQTYFIDPDRENGIVLLVGLTEPALYEPKVTEPLKTWPVTWSGLRLPLHDVACREEEIEAAFRRFAPKVRRI
ncbi:hypothetical protein FG93_03983 [Bosea sp. LC85]|uniref:hypothetical protein n=1 Tax=Bosea sp. LC85 TaxID=1502851 RepID=UPI0004E2D33F|nr:hypothetical protein [Bosea sp. LC85]KFC67248.1 hypothetical protein FG93_03983 [Bosea sp. LC85]